MTSANKVDQTNPSKEIIYYVASLDVKQKPNLMILFLEHKDGTLTIYHRVYIVLPSQLS